MAKQIVSYEAKKKQLSIKPLVNFIGIRHAYHTNENVTIDYWIIDNSFAKEGDRLVVCKYPQEACSNKLNPHCWAAPTKGHGNYRKVQIKIPEKPNKAGQLFHICYETAMGHVLGTSIPFTILDWVEINPVIDAPLRCNKELGGNNMEWIEKTRIQDFLSECPNFGVKDKEGLNPCTQATGSGRKEAQTTGTVNKIHEKSEEIKKLIEMLENLHLEAKTKEAQLELKLRAKNEVLQNLTSQTNAQKLCDIVKDKQKQELVELLARNFNLKDDIASVEYAMVFDEYANMNKYNKELDEKYQKRQSIRHWLNDDEEAKMFKASQIKDLLIIKSLEQKKEELQKLLSREENTEEQELNPQSILHEHKNEIDEKVTKIEALKDEADLLKAVYYSRQPFIKKIQDLKLKVAERDQEIKQLENNQISENSKIDRKLIDHIKVLEEKINKHDSEIFNLQEKLFDLLEKVSAEQAGLRNRETNTETQKSDQSSMTYEVVNKQIGSDGKLEAFRSKAGPVHRSKSSQPPCHNPATNPLEGIKLNPANTRAVSSDIGTKTKNDENEKALQALLKLITIPQPPPIPDEWFENSKPQKEVRDATSSESFREAMLQMFAELKESKTSMEQKDNIMRSDTNEPRSSHSLSTQSVIKNIGKAHKSQSNQSLLLDAINLLITGCSRSNPINRGTDLGPEVKNSIAETLKNIIAEKGLTDILSNDSLCESMKGLFDEKKPKME